MDSLIIGMITQLGGKDWLANMSVENLFSYLAARLKMVSMEIAEYKQTGWITFLDCQGPNLTLRMYIYEVGNFPKLYYRVSRNYDECSDGYFLVRESTGFVSQNDYRARTEKCENQLEFYEEWGC